MRKIIIIVFVFVLNAAYTQTFQSIPKILELSTRQYIRSGILGSVIGFGAGHALQNRYATKGWIFTLSEGSSAACYVAGMLTLNAAERIAFEMQANGPPIDLLLIGIGLGGLGFFSFLGFKIWEIVDLWSTAKQNTILKDDEASKGKISILPVLAPTYFGFFLVY